MTKRLFESFCIIFGSISQGGDQFDSYFALFVKLLRRDKLR